MFQVSFYQAIEKQATRSSRFSRREEKNRKPLKGLEKQKKNKERRYTYIHLIIPECCCFLIISHSALPVIKLGFSNVKLQRSKDERNAQLYDLTLCKSPLPPGQAMPLLCTAQRGNRLDISLGRE